MHKNLLAPLVIFILLASACKKTDQNALSGQNLPGLIDSIQFTDFPAIAWKIRTDTFPYVLSNTVNLPFKTALTQLKLSLHVVNATKIEIVQTDVNNQSSTKSILLQPGNNSVNVSVDYYKPITLKVYDNDFASPYILRVNENSLPDPDFTDLTVKLDPNNLAPLSAALSVSSSEKVSVAYVVKGQDGEDYSNQDPNFANTHAMNLFGLYPDYKNKVQVTITNAEGSMASKDVYVTTAPVPSTFPDQGDIKVNILDTSSRTRFILYYPYKTQHWQPFDNPGNMSYPIVMDRYGKTRWYLNTPFVLDMRPMPNGHFLVAYYGALFREVDLMGNIYKEIIPPTICHHDFQLLPNGNILYTGADLSVNNTDEDKIYEIDYNTGAVVKMINLYDLLDPTRKQNPFIASAPNDWFHNNSLVYDAADNSIVVSGRHQSTICKIDYASNQVKWIISDPTMWNAPWTNYLLQPTGSNFEYSWGQHSIQLNPLDHNSLIVFDNGNARSYTSPLKPSSNYSRLVEFSINPAAKTVSQSFDFGKEMGSENFSPALGSVDYVKDNMLICFPLIMKDKNGVASANSTPSVRFMEVDRNKKVLLDIQVKNSDPLSGNGYHSYRGHPFSF